MKESNKSEFQVSKRLPIPEITHKSKYPWAEMSVGDSFFVPGKHTTQMGGVAHQAGISLGVKFTIRRVTEMQVSGVRIWRVA